jgi:hypothetical protein
MPFSKPFERGYRGLYAFAGTRAPRGKRAVSGLPCEEKNRSGTGLEAHQSQGLSGNFIRSDDEGLVQMQIATRYGLLLVSD